jgi:hypothetical protein
LDVSLLRADGAQTLSDTYPLEPTGSAGFYVKGNCLVAYALTPGYETYKGLGWYGVIEVRLNSQPRV